MLCPNCNVDRGPGTNFCKDCGSKTISPRKRCKNNKEDGTLCDEPIEEDATFCSSCGKKIETEGVFVDAEADGVTVSSCPSDDNVPKRESTPEDSDSEEFEDALESIDCVDDIQHDTESDRFPSNTSGEVKEDEGFVQSSEQTSQNDTIREPESVVNQIAEPQENVGGASFFTKQMETRIETNVDSFEQSLIYDVETVTVHFHILLPSNVKFQPEIDFVYLNLSIADINDVLSRKLKMDYVETHADANNSAEMKGEVSIEKSQIIKSRLTYRYFVERNSKGKNDTKRESFWELCFMQGKEIKNREMSAKSILQSVTNTQGHFHVYDGLVYDPKQLYSLRSTGLVQTVISTVTFSEKQPCVESKKDADIVMKAFSKGIAQTWSRKLSASHLVAVMNHMCYELINNTKLRYLHGKDTQIVSQQINQTLWKAFVDFYQHLQEATSAEDRKRKVCILIVMLFLRRLTFQTDAQPSYLLASKFLVEVDKQKRCVYEWDVLEKNFSIAERNSLRSDLIQLASDMTKSMTKNSFWWYLLPWIHFLSGECVPFDDAPREATHTARIPKWWGFGSLELEQCKDAYKKSVETNVSIFPVIRTMKEVFHADYYLPRAIIACCDLQDIKEVLDNEEIDIPFEVFYAAMAYYVDNFETANLVSDCLNKLMFRAQIHEKGVCQTRLWLRAAISCDMACRAIQAHNGHQHHIESCIKLYLLSAAQYDNDLVNEANEEGIRCNDRTLTFIGNLVVKRIEISRFRSLEDQIGFWDRMICPSSYIQSKRIQDTWNGLITHALHDRISHSVMADALPKQDLVTIYCSNMNNYQGPLQDVLKHFITEILKDPQSLEKIYGSYTEEIRMLMLNTFNDQWNDLENRYQGMNLEVICQWRNLQFFLTVLCQGDGADTRELHNLKKVIDDIEKYASLIISGQIKMKDLWVVSQNEKEFMNIVNFTKYKDIGPIEKAVFVRTREYLSLLEVKRKLEQVKDFCRNLTLDLTALDRLLETNFKESSLSDIIDVTPEVAFAEFNESSVQLKALPFTDEICNLVKIIEKYGNSHYFKKAWAEECKRHEGKADNYSLKDVYCQVAIPLLQSLETFSDTIKLKTISFEKMEDRLGYLYEKNYNNLQAELATVCSGTEVCDTAFVTTQLKNYRTLKQMKDVAVTLLEIRRKYELTGNFDIIKRISETDVGTLQIKQPITGDVDLCPEIQNVTNEQHKCLKAFVDCYDLVLWLREEMNESTPKERRVFVDIATITAGDNVEQASRVQSFEAAVLAYSSLIFDLDSSGDYQHLVNMCEKVWKEQENIESLPEKLLHVNAHLPWFKHIKKTHGAVEMTSLMQAETINDYGKYTIGKEDIQNTATHEIDMDSVMILRVPASQDGVREKKEYKFSELQDLQSRLLLVGSEKEQNKLSIDRFTTIFDGSIRLCKIYIDLVSSGCVFFKKFSIQVYCNPSPGRPVCVVLEFKNGSDITRLKCHKSEEELIEHIMPKVATSMETCMSEWLDYVKTSRSAHSHLNYFTTDQLVILQREIAKVCREESPEKIVYPILQMIKMHCTIDDIRSAIDCANKEIEKEGVETSGQGECEQLPSRDRDRIQNISKMNIFIQKLINAKFKDMLPLALDHFKDDYDYSKAIAWCFQNRKRKTELETILAKKQAEKLPEQISSNSFGDIARIADSNVKVCDQMLGEFKMIWDTFIKSGSSNLLDFISMRHLGIILYHLVKDKKEMPDLHRKFPPNYDVTVPNLIVCPSHNVLQTTLSLYMTEGNQPLPQADEVLLCSPYTKLDEVDIFLRRAIFASKGRIHCLVFADLLGHTECEQVDILLKEHLRNRNESANFRLVIVCTSENEHTSSIVSSLDVYRREPVELTVERVAEYIAENVKDYDADSAASTDFERSSVRFVRSMRSGMGKSLYKKRKEEQLHRMLKVKSPVSVTLTLHGKDIDFDKIVRRLLPYTREPGLISPMIIHIDVSNEVYANHGLDFLLFKLLILGYMSNSAGYVWRKNHLDLYLIERLTPDENDIVSEFTCQVLKLLPSTMCLSPEESFELYKQRRQRGYCPDDQLFDQQMYEGEEYQMTYDYLRQLERGVMRTNTDSLSARFPKKDVLETLLKHCQIKDPSWSELYYFVHFLYIQLKDFRSNVFLSPDLRHELPGFAIFVLKFLLQMSKDFSSRSLSISEETEDDDTCLSAYKMKRTWESSPHPYIFFNSDGETFTFLGFFIDPNTFDLVDQQTNTVLESRVMNRFLHEALLNNCVPIEENFDQLDRFAKMERICRVMDMPLPDTDPDETYELTADNAKKIMAIYMRFRCNIPVIVMGETGCGKTRLVKFMCDLMHRDGSENMIIMKVHGGTTENDIKQKVREAEKIAISNKAKYERETENEDSIRNNVYTVLFFDEANTTESIGLIKEIMCDKTMDGEPLSLCKNLKFVAACNPYRRHPKKLIEKLEKAGLGYHVHANETTDRLGRIAMRRLVYRVQPLPRSLIPFVWDFGQLSEYVEKLYIRQMVKRYVRQNLLPDDQQLVEVMTTILGRSQEYMRRVEDECSFVSLRDVERVLQVMCWFLSLNKTNSVWFDLVDKKLETKHGGKSQFENVKLDGITRCLVLSIGVCYHAGLSNKEEYRKFISQYFQEPCFLPLGSDQIMDELDSCQEVILDKVLLEGNIARNQALKENIFMMVVCIELRIPLFLVGKPGSSKSLAKAIVTDAMQGNASNEPLFKNLKQVQMLSFQCSPISTPQGIISTFKSCAMFQRGKKLTNFVSAVVLDEIGLAEDSPRMPLKTLHALLEFGCECDDILADERKVAFIGISNWALDPAKMNRGIFVQREIPDSKELEITAKGICSASMKIPQIHAKLIQPLAVAYLEIFQLAVLSRAKREFFGLRDFYCLMKTVNVFMKKSDRLPTYNELMFAILRNFSGLEFDDEDEENVQEVFMKNMSYPKRLRNIRDDDQKYDLPNMIETCLKDPASRHLLLLTENYNALTTFEQKILKTSFEHTTIFGSSFRKDQEYTQVCRNISRVKLCMETGKTVILLNSENLYESLYDVLNQYYVQLGGQKFVDLGLGSHRVKCRVHKDFKLIIVAEKQLVYDMFPIPLINRLEKHILTSNTMLSNKQNDIAEAVKEWAQEFAKATLCLREQASEKDIGKVIIGYHGDACSAIVVDIFNNKIEQSKDQAIQQAKEILMWCATPDAVLRLSMTTLLNATHLQELYWQSQAHDSITQYLEYQSNTRTCNKLFSQVTTHGRLLVNNHRYILSEVAGIESERILLLESLTAFDTEQQFNNKIREHLELSNGNQTLLIVQCENGDANVNLIACARNSVLDECGKYKRKLQDKMSIAECGPQKDGSVHVLFIIQMPTTTNGNFKSIQCGDWHSAHIDHLISARNIMPSVVEMQGKSIGNLMQEAVELTFGCYDDHVALEERKGPAAIPKNGINLKEILSECVHGSMSRVKDTGETGYRTTQRITLLLKLLQEDTSNGSKSFLKEISVKLTMMLQDKDRITHQPENWIAKKAASLDVIVKTGTMRLACLQTFKSTISPILGGMIAFLDTNQNLNILQADVSAWQYRAWLAILEAYGAIPLSYAGMFPEGDTDSNRDFVVNGTNVNGLSFQSCMPFSWLIREKIDDILRFKLENYDTTKENDRDIRWSLFEESPIGKALMCVSSPERDDMINSYIQDYLNMVYPFEKDTELRVVAQYLKEKIDFLTEKGQTNLIDVHTTYAKLENRLKYFRDISHVWDKCSTVLCEEKECKIMSQDITIRALYLLVNYISTNTKTKCDLTTADGRRAWLDGVHRCRHVVQQTLGYYLSEQITTDSDVDLLLIRSMWNRVVLLQLFLEDVCTGNDADSITIDITFALWEMMTDDDDMKKIETLSKLDDFLETCYDTAQAEYNQTAEKCSNCDSALHHQKTMLPCEHLICEPCLQELQSQETQTCFACKTPLPDGWEDHEDNSDMKMHDKLEDYKKRCNTFYMNVVSQLCFSQNQAPSDDVVDKLMAYPFQHTGLEISENRTGVDPDDAFKAFILKLLIRSSERKLHEQLEKHFNNMQINLCDNYQELDSQRTRLIFLVVCCIEDNYIEKEQLQNETDVNKACRLVRYCQQLFTEIHSPVEKVFGIAYARIALATVANYIHLIVKKHEMSEEQDNTSLEELFSESEILCRSYWPWKYLVQHIYKRYGMDTLLTACRTKSASIEWIYREREMENLTSEVDMYLCCGDAYIQMRHTVLNFRNSKEEADIKMQLNPYKRVLLELAFHREVSIPMQRNDSKWSDEDLQRLTECESLQHEMFSKLLIKNQLEGQPFEIVSDENCLLSSMKCLIFHWYRVLSNIDIEDDASTIMTPLICLATTPEVMQDAFLPTMPQDDIADLREMLKNTPVDYFGENPTLYECPNGHPYQVLDCGKPIFVEKCICGEAIGGRNHQLLQDNRPDTGGDRTSTGHTLGDADERKDGPFPERAMSRLHCACIRFILHLTISASCSSNIEAIAKLLKPSVNEMDVISFVMKHLLKDLEDMQTVLTCNTDDVFLLMHCLADNMMKMEHDDLSDDIEHEDEDVTWNTKIGRQNWEILFSRAILKPLIEESQENLENVKAKLKGSNHLMVMLDDNETQSSNEATTNCISENGKLWIYRTPITLKHFQQMFELFVSSEGCQGQNPLLKSFLENVAVLQALRFIPSVLKLHRVLFRKYKHKLNRKEATEITIRKIRNDQMESHGTGKLLDDTISAWNIVRKYLKNHVCNTEFGRIVVPKEIAETQITEDSSICVLLPTTEDNGVCTYAMLDMLIKQQNELLEVYARQYGRDSNGKGNIPTVQPNDLTFAHLVSFDIQCDLQSLILANSTWHLDDGTVEYNFRGFERQLVDRFIATKSKIALSPSLQIEQMVYHTDMKDADSLNRLEIKVPQEKMDRKKLAQICIDINTVPGLCQMLSVLDIAISILNVTGGTPTMNLSVYLEKTLKMEKIDLPFKIRQSCHLKHVQALWMYMYMKKSILMVEDGSVSEAVFDIVPQYFHVPLPKELLLVYESYLGGLKDDDLSELLDVMFQYIILRLTKREKEGDSSDEAKYPLKDCLDQMKENVVKDGFPTELLAENTVFAWFSVAKVVGKRKI